MKRLLATAAAVTLATTTGAFGAGSAGGVTVVAPHLNNPRGVWVAKDGSIYVAEAGKAGPASVAKDTFLGFSSAIVKVAGGPAERVVRNLISAGGRDGTFTTGADGVAVDPSGAMYVAMTGAPCALKAPAVAKAQIGQLLRVRGGKTDSVADLQSLECKNNYDRTDKNPNPYAVLALGGDHELVVDAGGNTVFDVRGKKARLLAVIPKLVNGAQAVPTSIALGPDGAYYVGAFGGEGKGKPKRNLSRVYRIVPGRKPTVYRSGFNAITGLAFAKDGTMYVTEFSTDPTNQNNFKGDVVAVSKSGARKHLGVGSLFYPAGAAIGADGALYVSNWSILPGTAPKTGPFKGKNGELVRLSLS
jgi:sugar lactone lactonase YvrE